MAAELTEIVQTYPERQRRRSLGRQDQTGVARSAVAACARPDRRRVPRRQGGGGSLSAGRIGGKRFANVRDTDERWRAVSQVLRDYDARNVLDIGCAEGSFVAPPPIAIASPSVSRRPTPRSWGSWRGCMIVLSARRRSRLS